MALTQHLRGELGRWLAEHCPVLDEVAAQVATEAEQVQPTRPKKTAGPAHYAIVGGAVDARLALAVDGAPPYGALLGYARSGSITAAAAGCYASQWPTHTSVPTTDRTAGCWIRTLPTGEYVHFGSPPENHLGGDPQFDELDQELRALTTAIGPGRLGTHRQEHRLAELCVLVGELDAVYRSPTATIGAAAGALVAGKPVTIAQELTSDTAAVVRAAAATLEQARHSVGQQPVLGTSAPVFTPGWAEGDLILGRRGTGQSQTLFEVKTSLAAHHPSKVSEWLRQTLAYALLDGRDLWQIRQLGLWLPRQGMVRAWPLQQFTGALRCSPAEFRALADECWQHDLQA